MVQFGLLDSYRRLAVSRWTKFTTEEIFWLIFDDFESIQITTLSLFVAVLSRTPFGAYAEPGELV